MSLKQWQQKNKLKDQEAADNCNLPKRTYLHIRDHREPNTRLLNIMRIMASTGLDWQELIKGNSEVKRLIKRIKS